MRQQGMLDLHLSSSLLSHKQVVQISACHCSQWQKALAYLCNFWAIYSWARLNSAQNNLIWLSAALSRPVDFQSSIQANYLFIEVGLLKCFFFPHVFFFFVVCSSRSVTLINSGKACQSNSLFFLYYSSWILSWDAVLVTADALWVRMSVLEPKIIFLCVTCILT